MRDTIEKYERQELEESTKNLYAVAQNLFKEIIENVDAQKLSSLRGQDMVSTQSASEIADEPADRRT